MLTSAIVVFNQFWFDTKRYINALLLGNTIYDKYFDRPSLVLTIVSTD